MVSLPFSKNKHYLTGIDWILHGFDWMNKRATGAGNTFQIVMELDSLPVENEVRDWLDGCIRKFPLLNGRTRRDYNLAPYWAVPSQIQRAAFAFDVDHLRGAEEAFPLLERAVNTPFRSEREHLAFHLIYAGESSQVAVKFDHRLFDAHGAEMFLGMLQQDWEEGGACRWEPPPCEPAHLSRWRGKFAAGRHVNRALFPLTEQAPPRALRLDPASTAQGFNFGGILLDEQQSREVIERAEREAGYLMAMPYTMALTVQALHTLFVGRGMETGDYIIPVTMDTRAPGGSFEEVFFNHVSLLLFRVQAREADDLPALLKSIKRQMYDQAKEGLARHILDASLLLRIAPLPAVSYVLKLYLKKDLASFCFSFLGDTGHAPTRFMGRKIRRSYHMARVPVPPGLGVFFHHSHGRLGVRLSYARGLLTDRRGKNAPGIPGVQFGWAMTGTGVTCDVIVVGSGVAGVSAAVRAAREGAQTILMERNGFPGGVAVAGMHRFICGLYPNGSRLAGQHPQRRDRRRDMREIGGARPGEAGPADGQGPRPPLFDSRSRFDSSIADRR